jgi:tRNA(fMet)-specific endonuclease VapC
MIVLDTDHFSEFIKGNESVSGKRLANRMRNSGEEFCTTIITFEEQLRGWLAEIHRTKNVLWQQETYADLRRVLDSFGEWDVYDWDEPAAERFQRFRSDGILIGPLDLKIACGTLELRATLLTANAKDFGKVPGLKFEDWLH